MEREPVPTRERALQLLLSRIKYSKLSMIYQQRMSQGVEFVFQAQCSICHGAGHNYKRCSTLRVIRRTLKKVDRHTEWKQLLEKLPTTV